MTIAGAVGGLVGDILQQDGDILNLARQDSILDTAVWQILCA